MLIIMYINYIIWLNEPFINTISENMGTFSRFLYLSNPKDIPMYKQYKKDKGGRLSISF